MPHSGQDKKPKKGKARVSKEEVESDLKMLCHAIQLCGADEALLWNFLRDLLSRQEIHDCKVRWQIAQLLLQEEMPQSQIAQQLQVAPATVSHVDERIHGDGGTGGYAEVYRRLSDADGAEHEEADSPE
jgi:uncharacterized protein YerC